MYASKVVELAKSWIGKKESDGSHKMIIDVYNSQKKLARNYKVSYTDSWCATFISALFVKLGYTELLDTECSCEQMVLLAKKKGTFVESDSYIPKAGDIVFYDWQDSGKGDCTGWSDHTGLIEKVNGKVITVIEGNYSDSVKRRTLEVNGKYIRGYIVPKYQEEKKVIYRIQVGAYANKNNAEKQLQKLKKAGFDGFIVSS